MTKRPTANPLQPRTRREVAARTTPAPAAGRVYGYARVSTARQADEGESLDVQQRQTSRRVRGWRGLAVGRLVTEWAFL